MDGCLYLLITYFINVYKQLKDVSRHPLTKLC